MHLAYLWLFVLLCFLQQIFRGSMSPPPSEPKSETCNLFIFFIYFPLYFRSSVPL